MLGESAKVGHIFLNKSQIREYRKKLVEDILYPELTWAKDAKVLLTYRSPITQMPFSLHVQKTASLLPGAKK